MEKYELIPEQLIREDVVEECQFFHPEKLEEKWILLTHTEEYWNKLKTNQISRKEARSIGFPIRPELINRGRYIAKGTIDCVKYAMESGVALNVAGGTHHSFADRGEGFCIYNDFAIAANYYLHHQTFNRILIVDLDVHQGNGTAKIFENEERIFTFSMHGKRNYPLRKEQSDLDIELADGTNDKKYLNILKSNLPKVIYEFKPQVIFFLAGVDVLDSDKLGRLSLTKRGCFERDLFVFETCRDLEIPVTVSMGGGYSQRIADLVDAHVNTFKAAIQIFS